jgi:hypothetical protein
MRWMKGVLFAALAVASGATHAETLPLPSNLVSFESDEGEALLIGAEARSDFFPLVSHFTNQINPAYCGPASISMVLNALNVPRPASDTTAGLGLFDQENIFTPTTDAVQPAAAILSPPFGMTLAQLGGVLAAHHVTVQITYASESSVEAFRDAAVGALEDDAHFVLVNYLRKTIGQEAGGHISPLAAYDADTDRFLILDVSRYKYPPIWVQATELFKAMNTEDTDAGKSRGYILVSR